MMTKLTHLKKYSVILMMENTDEQSVIDEVNNLPSDVHIITYMDDGVKKQDAMRAFKMSDIFDGYYDFGIKEVISIKSGYGNVKPKLYNPNKEEDKKK